MDNLFLTILLTLMCAYFVEYTKYLANGVKNKILSVDQSVKVVFGYLLHWFLLPIAIPAVLIGFNVI